jgi:Arc/MetJ family transcription regulator
MAVATTSIRVNTRLADEAKKILGVKSRSEAARIALREILGLPGAVARHLPRCLHRKPQPNRLRHGHQRRQPRVSSNG